MSNSVNVHAVNNGTFSIATMAAGSNFEERHNIESAYDVAIDAAANAQDYAAQIKFEHEKNEALKTYDAYSASHNTIRLITEAHTKGSVVNRIGGGIQVSVEVQLMYLCAPGCANELEQSLVQQVTASPIFGTGIGAMIQPHNARMIKDFDVAAWNSLNATSSRPMRVLSAMPVNGKTFSQ